MSSEIQDVRIHPLVRSQSATVRQDVLPCRCTVPGGKRKFQFLVLNSYISVLLFLDHLCHTSMAMYLVPAPDALLRCRMGRNVVGAVSMDCL